MRLRSHTLQRTKLPPILEIDEDGISVSEHEAWGRPHFNSEEGGASVQLGSWPSELDD